MKLKYIGIAFLLIGIVNACSKPLEETYSTELKFPEFINVEVLNASAVTIEYGEEQQIIVTGNEFAIKDVVTEVISETLIIDKENENSEGLTYRIITPFVREVKNASTTNIEIEDFDQEGYLSLISTSTGNINLGQFDNLVLLNVSIESEGSVFGNNNFDSLIDLNIKITGSGEYNAFAIKSKNVIAEIEGTGSCSVYAIQELTAIINGSGFVYYRGYPTINVSNYGAGNVIDAN